MQVKWENRELKHVFPKEIARDAETSEPVKPSKSILEIQEDIPGPWKPARADEGGCQPVKKDGHDEMDEAVKSHQ